MHFLGGKKAFVKTDGGKKELSGLELVDEIKRREGVIFDERRIAEVSEALSILNTVKPLLFWWDKPIPLKEAKNYFRALSSLFYAPSALFDGINKDLLSSTDNLLRVICALPKKDGYTYQKLHISCKHLYVYLATADIPPLDFDLHSMDLQECLFSMKRGLEGLLGCPGESAHEELLLARFLSPLVAYTQDQVHSHRLKVLSRVTLEITQSLQALIEPLVKVKMGFKFPEKSSENSDREIQHHCEQDWLLFVKEYERRFSFF